MLNDFRSLTGNLAAKILLLLLVLSFAIWGIGDMVRQSGSNMAVATVGGKKIEAREFNQELRRATESMRRALGDHFSPEMIRMTNLHVQVLQRMISQKLLAMESASLGIIPSDTDVVRRIRSTPAFLDKNGNFDKDQFENMLRGAGLSEKTYVNQLRKDMATDLLVDTLLANVPVPETAANILFAAREQQRQVTFYALSPSLVSNVPQPDNQSITDYYNANARSFTAPEYRNLSYIVISDDDIKAGAAVTEDELLKTYRERKDEFKRSERREVQQLLYSSKDAAEKAFAMLEKGNSFEQVAEQTEILNKNAVSLGKVDRNSVMENAADTVFALKKGDFTSPIESPFGWHIFRVAAIEPPSVTPFDEVRPMLERELKQRHADDAQSRLANQLEDSLAAGSTLQEAAKEMHLKVNTVGPVSKEGLHLDGTQARELPELDKFLETAFKIDEKSQSSLVSSRGGKYYIVQVDNIVPERLRALDEVRGLVVSGWQMQERAKRLGELAKVIAGKFARENSRNEVIAKYGLAPASSNMIKRSTRTAGSLTLPADLVEDVFLRPAGDATKAYPVDKGQYVIAVVNRIIPANMQSGDPRTKEALADIRSTLGSNIQNELLAEYTHYLAEKYTVSVDESAFDTVTE